MPNVIKPTQYSNATSKLCTGETINPLSIADTFISDAMEKARNIIELAEKESCDIITEAHRASEAMERKSRANFDKAYEDGLSSGTEDGFRRGFEKGYEEGFAKAQQDLSEQTRLFKAAVKELYDCREQVIKDQEDSFPSIVVEISQRVIGKTLTEDASIISDLVKQTISEYRSRDWANIYVAPQIFEQLNKPDCNFVQGITQISPGARLFSRREFDADDCVIELENEVVDISVKTQLAKVKIALSK